MRSFGQWLLQLGEGLIESTKHDRETEASWIKIPDELLIYTDELKIKAIFEYTYPDFIKNYFNTEYLKQRAILTPTNDLADEINAYILDIVPKQSKEYLSVDSISKCFDTCNDADILYPTEYLNTLNANNFPQHRLVLKVGVPIMLLRNLNQGIGLCNGTRLIITNLGDNSIEAAIITGTNIGSKDTTYKPYDKRD